MLPRHLSTGESVKSSLRNDDLSYNHHVLVAPIATNMTKELCGKDKKFKC